MSDDTYEGWPNRETWAANLWMSNEEGWYLQTVEQAREAWANAAEEIAEEGNLWSDRASCARYYLAEVLEAEWEELATRAEDGDRAATSILLDVGSAYRIDWGAIAEHWLIDVIAEETGQ